MDSEEVKVQEAEIVEEAQSVESTEVPVVEEVKEPEVTEQPLEPPKEEPPPPEPPPFSPDPVPETAVNIDIPPIALETGDTEGIERAQEQQIQISGEPEEKEKLPENKEQPASAAIEPPDPNKPYTVRSEETGDKVYFVKEGKRYWVKNVETLTKLGSHLGQEIKMPFSEILKLPEGEPLDTTLPNFKFPWDKTPTEIAEEEKASKPTSVWG